MKGDWLVVGIGIALAVLVVGGLLLFTVGHRQRTVQVQQLQAQKRAVQAQVQQLQVLRPIPANQTTIEGTTVEIEEPKAPDEPKAEAETEKEEQQTEDETSAE